MNVEGLTTLRAHIEPGRGRLGPPPPLRAPVRRPARVALMLALAHRIERQIAAGEIADRADAARRLGLTRARVTQLCDLTLLAPDIQEQILFLDSEDGVEPLSERALRPIVATASWSRQRDLWRVRVGSQLS